MTIKKNTSRIKLVNDDHGVAGWIAFTVDAGNSSLYEHTGLYESFKGMSLFVPLDTACMS